MIVNLIILSNFAVAENNTQILSTMLFFRHGEKPDEGLGQINCKGLQRALALPKVLEQRFGKPTALFAANPGEQKIDHGISYNYVRPLATIEPAAVQFEMPVNTEFGIKTFKQLPELLISKATDPDGKGIKMWISWEHKQLVEIVRDIIKKFNGDAAAQEIPKWKKGFDDIYIIELYREGNNGPIKANFRIEQQSLNGLPNTCSV